MFIVTNAEYDIVFQTIITRTKNKENANFYKKKKTNLFEDIN